MSAMEYSDRIGIKVFSAANQPDWGELIAVFQSWIQQQNIAGHLLIDVHDYRHIQQGPGILLVGHEGNFSFDLTEGRPGLAYFRKQPLEGSPTDRFATILSTVLSGCSLLENNTTMPYRVRFERKELRIIGNDRLYAPNLPSTFDLLQPVVRDALAQLFPAANYSLCQAVNSPKERFTMTAIQN